MTVLTLIFSHPVFSIIALILVFKGIIQIIEAIKGTHEETIDS